MTVRGTISALDARRAAGTVTRDEYWAAMREHHRRLADYRPLLQRAGFQRLEVRPGGLVLRDDVAIDWWWDPGELRSPLSVRLNDGAYEHQEWRALRALASRDAAFLDVGANIGWYSIRLARSAGVRDIHAFEPVPSTYAALTANVRLNRLGRRIRTHPFGLSDRRTSSTFFVPRHTGNVAASERPLLQAEHQDEVAAELRRLDDLDLGTTRIGLVKCDVEGGEFGFLQGAEATLIAHRPFVMVELLRKWAARFGYRPNDVIAWMRARDFRCFAFERVVQEVREIDERTTATNFLFAHASTVDAFRTVLRAEFDDVEFD